MCGSCTSGEVRRRNRMLVLLGKSIGALCLVCQGSRRVLEEALRLSQKNNEKLIEGFSWLLLGTILGKSEPLDFNKSEGCILKGIEICNGLKLKAYYSLGHLSLGESLS